ncbi:hypothetical protein FRC03_002560 [Tulasnella sp. 419]|nr:hypothetical protein FRC03_002560 [Tulasnella sp. 419]
MATNTTSFNVPVLTPEGEDALILERLANNEAILRRLTRKFHTLSNLSKALANPSENQSGSNADNKPVTQSDVDEAREAFLVDIGLFQAFLMKNLLVCQAEARQVMEYEREKQRITAEHNAFREDIANLKVALEEAQTLRKRKIEYDAIAEKINAWPTRTELESAVATLNEELVLERTNRDTQMSEMQDRRVEFDNIVNAISEIRARGFAKTDLEKGDLDKGDLEKAAEGSEEGAIAEDGSDSKAIQHLEYAGAASSAHPETSGTGTPHLHPQTSLNPGAKTFTPNLGPKLSATPISSRPGTPSKHPIHLPALRNGLSRANTPSMPQVQKDDDIEMGELAEDPPPPRPSNGGALSGGVSLGVPGVQKRRPREELEEGEASDSGSSLSELPSEYQS